MATTKNGIYYPNDKTQKATILSDLQKMAESIDTAINNNKFDPTQINNSIQELETDISDLQTSQEEQDSDIKALTNALPSETSEAEDINIKGTIPVKFKEFKVSGNSKQETRSGKNLFNKADEPVINNSNIKLEQTETGIKATMIEEDAFDYIIYKLKDVSDYIGKTVRLKTNITYEDTNTTNSNPRIGIGLADENVYSSSRKTFAALTESGEISFTINEKDITTMPYLIVWIYPRISSDSTTGKATTTFDDLIVTVDNEDMTYEPYGAMPSPEYPSEIQNAEGDVNVTVANKEKTEQQTVTFPLSEGQKLMLGDYLAEDGIHHVRKQVELDGTENWELYSDKAARILRSDVKGVSDTSHIGSILSNFFKTETQADLQMGVADNGIAVRTKGYKGIVIRIAEFTTLQEYKDWLSSKKSEGTPVIAEYELAEEETEAYTEEQQEAYNQIKELTAYEEETNIYSTNEVSPIFKVTAVKDINSVITQLNSVLLERS